MNNRLAMGLAVGAGYFLGRTKKAKLAFGIGTMVMGKKLQLSPRALAEFASSQLQNNPQFKEIGDQLREDLRGVGKAATGALVTRQINAVADRLHDRRLDVQDRLAGVVPDDVPDLRDEDEDEEDGEDEDREEEPEERDEPRQRSEPDGERRERRRKAPARKTPARRRRPRPRRPRPRRPRPRRPRPRRPPPRRRPPPPRREAGAVADTKGPQSLLSGDNEATQRLKEELQSYLMAQAVRMLTGAGRKLGESTLKLNDIAEGKSPGFAELAKKGGQKLAEGKGPVRGALEIGASHLKDSATNALKGLGGKGKKGGGGNKPVVIMEHIDVGVPVRDAYDQWTRFQDFSTFAKGVKSAGSADDTTSDWKLKVFWSNRSWKAHTTEQVPDTRIAWTSEGAKGTTKGVVTFHPLGENLTRVLLVMEYYPKGLFEKTGNIWRAQGRRVRLDLKHFARHISIKGEAEDGWRGEIRDGEVVRSHDDAVAEEEGEEQPQQEEEVEPEGEYEDEEYVDEVDEPEAGEEAEEEEEYAAEDEAEYEAGDEGEYEDEDADTRKQREYADSGSRGRR